MQELLDHIEKVKNLKRNILDYAEQVVEENADKIEQFNLEQLNDGIDSDGQDIKPGYTPLTIKIKTAKGQPTDRVTLHDKGNFYAGVELKKVGSVYDMTDTDSKTKKLQAKYGKKILGLTNENEQRVIDEIVMPALIEKTPDLI